LRIGKSGNRWRWALRPIYTAASAEAAAAALDAFADGPWGTKFPTVVASWRRAWPHVIPFFAFPPEIRRVIYTTNALESVHAQLRKIIKTRGHFPNDDAATNMKATLLPLQSVIEVLDDELASADDQFAAMVANDAVVKRLTTLPSIGPITASAYVAALDDVKRFGGAGQVTSYLGLVPREYSSGEQQRRGCVLRRAYPHVQSLLVLAAWRMSRSSSPDTAGLRTWAQAIARRRGKKVAMVALARRLARILFAMWRDETEYQAHRIREKQRKPAATSTHREASAAL
jgi:hypothetical protein